ncbi:MAG: hypothetical protein ACI8RD_006723, partial [Bacillariaceae sp.]
ISLFVCLFVCLFVGRKRRLTYFLPPFHFSSSKALQSVLLTVEEAKMMNPQMPATTNNGNIDGAMILESTD